MKTLLTQKSDDVRQNWRKTLESVWTGQSTVVIERYSDPAAVIISYDDWTDYQQLKRTAQATEQLKSAEFIDITDEIGFLSDEEMKVVNDQAADHALSY